MDDTQVRQALLDDTQGISALFRSRIEVWQRLDARGRVEDLTHDALTVYERWLHGSRNDAAWMSLETGVILLSQLRKGAGLPLVVVAGREVLAYAEAYPSAEPEPFGDHLHLAHLVVHPKHSSAGLDDLLLRHLLDNAKMLMDCRRITVSLPAYDTDSAVFYARYGMTPLMRVRRYALPARTGQSFYKATEHPKADSTQIRGWYMSVGRTESSGQQWEMLWPGLWDAVPEISARRTQRLHFSASGHEALMCFQQQLYNPRTADVYCWSPKPLTSQLLVAIRDWAHREGYRTLVFAVPEDAVKILGTEAESDPYDQRIYSVEL